MNKRGKLIIFEGIDGAGKTSISKAVADRLIHHGINCRWCAFPGHVAGTLGKLVYELHHSSSALGVNSISPAGLQALHIAAHLDSIENTILPALSDGVTIVLDRYWWSTWVYGTIDGVRGPILESLMSAEKAMWNQVLPDIVLLLDRIAPDLDRGAADLYRSLWAVEKDQYPALMLENNHGFLDAVDKALSLLNWPTSSQ